MPLTSFMASDLYGGAPSPQPVSTPGPAANTPGTPENKVRTVAPPSGFTNPTFLLVLILGVAFALIHFSVAGSVRVSA